MTLYKEKIDGFASDINGNIRYFSESTFKKKKINEKIIIKTSGFFNWRYFTSATSGVSVGTNRCKIVILLYDENENQGYYVVDWENSNKDKELEILISEFGEYKYFYGFLVYQLIYIKNVIYAQIILPSLGFEINIEVY